jgi:menaquinone-specific isochorismate synthase
VTTIDDASGEDLAPPGQPEPSASAYRIEPVTPVERYLDAVRAARDAVRDGGLTKAVIAREIEVVADRPIDRHGVLHRLRASFGSSYRFAVDGFVGASPELLVEVAGEEVRSHPLAGTAPRTGDVERDAAIAEELVASTKNQVEHRVVIDVVHDTLLPWCSYLDWEADPSIVTVANVQHLGTRIEGRLSSPRPNVLDLVRALSPTPAVGGHPRDEALALIAAVEGVERDRYGGAVGWVDAAGNGTWAVAIRCAQLSADRCRARLHAGGGIVADSDPLAELAETQAKFQAMLSALIRP